MKIVAYFLPQFYHTPENDKFWGKGFTDWNSVRGAKPYFRNHGSPLVPQKFGYYDLSDPATIKSLSTYSINKGVAGFGYWHYWFGNGKQTLEKVPEIHLNDPSISQNFFFSWANTNWTKSWVGDDETIIFKQTYSEQSAIDHFNYLLPFLEDERYLKKNGKPLFQVINPNTPEVHAHILKLENMCIEKFGHGFQWIFPLIKKFTGLEHLKPSIVGFPPGEYLADNAIFKLKRRFQKWGWINRPIKISEQDYLKSFKRNQLLTSKKKYDYIPCLLAGWDNTPRYGKKGFVIDSNISSLLKGQINLLKNIHGDLDKFDFVFIKAWNEWAEGNVIEPYSINGKIDFPIDVIKYL